jgi:hypothetical protein
MELGEAKPPSGMSKAGKSFCRSRSCN